MFSGAGGLRMRPPLASAPLWPDLRGHRRRALINLNQNITIIGRRLDIEFPLNSQGWAWQARGRRRRPEKRKTLLFQTNRN
jgi:hypothetical protein